MLHDANIRKQHRHSPRPTNGRAWIERPLEGPLWALRRLVAQSKSETGEYEITFDCMLHGKTAAPFRKPAPGHSKRKEHADLLPENSSQGSATIGHSQARHSKETLMGRKRGESSF
jgi:hypothetical protein